jgi:hypothetical protein
MSKKSASERVTLTFDLHDLPTAQHRAGLAGLILQIDSMGPEGNKRNPKVVPTIEEEKLTPTTATITFTTESMQGVFDDLYDAETVEATVATKWPATPPKRETTLGRKDSRTGEVKPVRAFVYDVVQPLAPCLHRHIQPDARAWITLWRQMIWEIPRGGNNVRSRAPFNETAGGKPCGEGSKAWTQTNKFLEKRAKSQFETEQISGALLLGAQAVNAEGVPFSGRIDHNLLLHFWQIVVLPFLPRVVNKKDGKVERYGYVLTIPDVADLIEFRREFPKMLGSLRADPSKSLPADAQIDLPDQANLEVLRQLKGLGSQERTGKSVGGTNHRGGRISGARRHMQTLATDKAAAEFGGGGVRAVESYHMVKQGNNIKLVSFARVADRPGLTEEYGRIQGSYRNPLFRAMLMRALIRAEPWHAGVIELFSEYPWPFFIEGDGTPRYLARFGRDANDKLRASYKDIQDMKPDEMNEEDRLKYLSTIIRRLVDRYVEGRAEAKTGMKAKTFAKRPIPGKGDRLYTVYPPEFREAQQRVCSDAFLSMRSRHDQDFIDFFASSVCSVAQFLPADQYEFLIQTLMTKPDANPLARKVLSWEDVLAIAMIAVSACSYRVRPREPQTQGSPS